MSANIVIIGGNLTRDPELTYTPKGNAVCSASIANNSKSGEKEIVTFVDVEAWGYAAEALATLKKGRPVMIQGRLKQETWQDKTTGNQRSKMVVVAWDVATIVFAPKSGDAPEPPSRPQPTAPPAAQPPPPAAPTDAEDDIPF